MRRASLCHRKPLIHGFDALKNAVLDAGAISFFISGSGSTCISIYRDEAYVERAKKAAAALAGGWRVLSLEVDLLGARAL